MFLVCIN